MIPVCAKTGHGEAALNLRFVKKSDFWEQAKTTCASVRLSQTHTCSSKWASFTIWQAVAKIVKCYRD